MTYNLTALQNASNMYGIVEFANNSTNGIFIGLLMISIFFILLLILKKYEMHNALLVSAYLSFILSLILSYAHLLNFIYVLIFFALSAFTLFYNYVVEN